jgi:DnaJ-class molecular chaperone
MRNRNYKIDNARKLLGVSKDATAEDAKKRYRELAKIWHPDINSNEEAHIKMQDINKSYALLMKEEFGILDPWEEYDRWWWRQYGNDPIWGNYFPEDNSEKPMKTKKMNRKKLLNTDVD